MTCSSRRQLCAQLRIFSLEPKNCKVKLLCCCSKASGFDRKLQIFYFCRSGSGIKDLVSSATLFIHRGYNAYLVAQNGSIISRDTVTLQHADTKLYVTADVLEDLTLNVGRGLSGVKLQVKCTNEDCSTKNNCNRNLNSALKHFRIFNHHLFA